MGGGVCIGHTIHFYTYTIHFYTHTFHKTKTKKTDSNNLAELRAEDKIFRYLREVAFFLRLKLQFLFDCSRPATNIQCKDCPPWTAMVIQYN